MAGAEYDIPDRRRTAGEGTVRLQRHSRIARANNGIGFMQRIGGAARAEARLALCCSLCQAAWVGRPAGWHRR